MMNFFAADFLKCFRKRGMGSVWRADAKMHTAVLLKIDLTLLFLTLCFLTETVLISAVK